MSDTIFSEKIIKASKDYTCGGCTMADHDFDFNFSPTKEEMKLFELVKKEKFNIKKGTPYFSQKGIYEGEFFHFRCRKDVYDFFTKRKLWEALSNY